MWANTVPNVFPPRIHCSRQAAQATWPRNASGRPKPLWPALQRGLYTNVDSDAINARRKMERAPTPRAAVDVPAAVCFDAAGALPAEFVCSPRTDSVCTRASSLKHSLPSDVAYIGTHGIVHTTTARLACVVLQCSVFHCRPCLFYFFFVPFGAL